MRGNTLRRLLLPVRAVLVIALLAGTQGLVTAQAAAAGVSSAASAGSTGYDISWPQCSSAYPSGGSFGIVGVTDGLPWSANPCLASESSWAATHAAPPQLYTNTANPAPHSSYYWPKSGSRDPALCKIATSRKDPGCAYDYGWHAAANALATAGSVNASAVQEVWWLDVETGNSWNGNGSSNAADLQGAIDYLRSHGVATVGVYSTAYQWNRITGGYTASTAASYAAGWRAEFTSAYGIASSPSWVAGASSLSAAPESCGSSFTGTSTRLVQYPSGGYDGDYACAGT